MDLRDARAFVPGMIEVLEKRGWLKFAERPGQVNETWTWKFYANVAVLSQEAVLITIRRVYIFIAPKNINKLLELAAQDPVYYVKTLALSNGECRIWAADILYPKEGEPPKFGNCRIKKSTFTLEAKNWVNCVLARLKPSKNDDDIPLHRAILTAAIMEGWPIEVDQVATAEIRDAFAKVSKSMHFPWVLIELMKKFKVTPT